jgi:hypothetical protein
MAERVGLKCSDDDAVRPNLLRLRVELPLSREVHEIEVLSLSLSGSLPSSLPVSPSLPFAHRPHSQM